MQADRLRDLAQGGAGRPGPGEAFASAASLPVELVLRFLERGLGAIRVCERFLLWACRHRAQPIRRGRQSSGMRPICDHDGAERFGTARNATAPSFNGQPSKRL
jgi:hypothetical protein